MNTFFRRHLAPLTETAWASIDAEASKTLRGNLSARAMVDVKGPMGFEYSALNLGRLDIKQPHGGKGANWGLRRVQPLVEVRCPFELSLWEIDNITRGAEDPELAPVNEAARNAAAFEERLVYAGMPDAGVGGVLASSAHKPVKIAANGTNFVETVAQAVLALQVSGVGGPYGLVLGTTLYDRLVQSHIDGYPLKPRVLDLLEGGSARWSPEVTGGVLLSRRGGDFELTIGQDFSVGFDHAVGDSLHLYITESLTFRVLEPLAAIALSASK